MQVQVSVFGMLQCVADSTAPHKRYKCCSLQHSSNTTSHHVFPAAVQFLLLIHQPAIWQRLLRSRQYNSWYCHICWWSGWQIGQGDEKAQARCTRGCGARCPCSRHTHTSCTGYSSSRREVKEVKNAKISVVAVLCALILTIERCACCSGNTCRIESYRNYRACRCTVRWTSRRITCLVHG